jgi:hypothetical protein
MVLRGHRAARGRATKMTSCVAIVAAPAGVTGARNIGAVEH